MAVRPVGPADAVESCHVVDVATGVLIGLRGCSEQEAIDELIDVIRETHIPPGDLAQSLVELVGGKRSSSPHRDQVAQRWGHLLAWRRAGAAAVGPEAVVARYGARNNSTLC